MKVLALFCVLLIGSAQCSPTKLNNAASEILLKIIDSITDALDAAISLGEYVIPKLASDGLDSIRLLSIRLLTKVLEAVEDAFKFRAEHTSDLDDDGVTYFHCLDSNRDDLNVGLLAFYTNFTACANPSILDLIKLLNPILEDLRGVEQKVAADAEGLHDCHTQTCIVGILLQILDDVLSIPDVVAANIQAAEDAVAAFPEVAKKCAAPTFDDFFIKLFNAFAQVAKCALA